MTDCTPDYTYERTKLSAGFTCIIGVDEVGRGPWAGPVVAAAAWLNPNDLPLDARDSKKLTAKKREALYPIIKEKAYVALGEASVEEIDALNIREATFLAMTRAIENLSETLSEFNIAPDFIAVDGNALPKNLPCPAEYVIKGDDKVLSIACASIVAKVYRDKLMADLAEKHPHYGWESNAGYGTKLHQQGLQNVGVTAHHRKSFKPIRTLLETTPHV